MNLRAAIQITGLALGLLAGCGQRVPTPATQQPIEVAKPGAVQEDDAAPFCSIDSHQEFGFAGGTKLLLWNFRARALKQLEVRLLILADGTAHAAQETQYRWQKWEPQQPAATGQLVYLLQDGQMLGVRGKRSPQLGLAMQNEPGHATIGTMRPAQLDGSLQSRLASVSKTTTPARKSILFTELYASPQDKAPLGLSSELDALTEASKHGRQIVAITFEWQPQ